MPRDESNNGRAIIPDPRNDENLIILQLHKGFAQFHNSLVDHARKIGIRREWVFETARRLVRWHYQWAVIHDFIPRMTGDDFVGKSGTVYKEVDGKPPVINLSYYRPTNKDGRPFMPVEFAVPAYRFAHSIIRPFYIINGSGVVNIFGPDGGFNLNGGRPIPADLVIEWKNILPVDPNFPARPPRKIDTKLSLPLTQLPGSAVPPPDPTKHLATQLLPDTPFAPLITVPGWGTVRAANYGAAVGNLDRWRGARQLSRLRFIACPVRVGWEAS
jgi:hypothetical protein